MATSYNISNAACTSNNIISLDQKSDNENLKQTQSSFTNTKSSIMNLNSSFCINSTKIKTCSSLYTCSNSIKTSAQNNRDSIGNNQTISLNINNSCTKNCISKTNDQVYQTNDLIIDKVIANDKYKMINLSTNDYNSINFHQNNTNKINEINNSKICIQKKDCNCLEPSNIIRRVQINKTDSQESSLKLERNYSYIEAIKDEKFKNINNIKIENSYNCNKLNISDNKISDCKNNNLYSQNDEINYVNLNSNYLKQETLVINKSSDLRCNIANSDLNKKTVIVLPIKSTSPSSASSTSSTSSSINKEITIKYNKKNSNLSKSKSQSNLINLFKTTFSPFTIRKWRSKSRDKISNNSDNKIYIKDIEQDCNYIQENKKTISLHTENLKNPSILNNERENKESNQFKHSSNNQNNVKDLKANIFQNKCKKENSNSQVAYNSNYFSPQQNCSNTINIKSSASTSSTASTSSSSLFSSAQTNLTEPISLSLKLVKNDENSTSPRTDVPHKIHINKVSTIASSTTIVRPNNNQIDTKKNFSKDLNNSNLFLNQEFNNDSNCLKNTHSFEEKKNDECSKLPIKDCSNKNFNKSGSPQNERQLSYLKLTCLVNGYDSFKCKKFDKPLKNSLNVNLALNNMGVIDDNVLNKKTSSKLVFDNNRKNNELENESLKLDDLLIKSAKVLDDSNRFYDLKKKMNNFGNSNLPYTLTLNSSRKIDEGINYCNIRNSNEQENDFNNLIKCENNLNIEKNIDRSITKKKLEDEETKNGDVNNYIKNISAIKILEDKAEKNSEETILDQKIDLIDNIKKSNIIKNSQDHNGLPENDLEISDEKSIIKDGNFYIKLLDESTNHINQLCEEYKIYIDETSENYLSNEEVLGHIQTAIGKGQLLISQKFKQFRGLCEKNIKDNSGLSEVKDGEFVTLNGDLAGFWDMVCLQIDDIERMFKNLHQLKLNNWKIEPCLSLNTNDKKKQFKNGSISSNNVKSSKNDSASTNRSVNSAKARSEAARQRLLEAKKNALKQKEAIKSATNNGSILEEPIVNDNT